MTPAEVSLILGLLALVATYAPGFLASLTGKGSDTAALAHAKATLDAIPFSPARRAIRP